jgi:hypothetical protein
MRLTVGLRTPLAFRLPGRLTIRLLDAPLDSVGIDFDGRRFVWHPPVDYKDETGTTQYGPMVSVMVSDDLRDSSASVTLQQFLSAASHLYAQPVEDVHYGSTPASGETDEFNPSGARAQRSFIATHVVEAPVSLFVATDDSLRLALALSRESANASSPFYSCLASWNMLNAVFEVMNETARQVATQEAAQRDAFIEAHAGLFAEWHHVPKPPRGWALYFRDEVRNALAHVKRPAGKSVVNPDDPRARVRLRNDAAVLRELGAEAVNERWPDGLRVVRRDQ